MRALTPMERRPAPLPSWTELGGDLPHGAPALLRGHLAAAPRDATFLKRPNVHGPKQNHVAIFSTRYRVGSGAHAITAACDPAAVMLDDGLLDPAHTIVRQARCRRRACQALFAAAYRQHGDLEHIRSYYRLEHRIGVRVALGLRVRHAGRPGVIIDTSGQYLIVRLDDEPVPVTVHATSEMEYEGAEGWVRAVPLPDPYAAV